MKNVILERWQGVLKERGAAAAVFSPEGAVERTFAQIEAEAAQIAGRLAGSPPGAVISLQAPNGAAWPALVLGIWRMGGCALLVDDAASGATRDAMERLCGAVLRLDGEAMMNLPHEPVELGAAPDLIKLTSGTSGAPRAILFSAAQLDADCDNVCATMGIGGGDVNYGVIAFSHSYGFSNLVTPLLCRGVPLVAARDVLPRAVMNGVVASGASVLPGVPALFQAMSGLAGGLGRLRLCISAGAPLRPETGRLFRERFGLKIHAFYGASECGGIAYDAAEDEVVEPGYVGVPLRGVTLEREEAGGIRVCSQAVGMGVFPDTEDAPGEGVFRPADLLEPAPGGWRITGRRTDVINVAGRKVSPSQIEEALLSHPGVREAVAFAKGDDARTDVVAACVVVDGAAEVSALRGHCASRLAPWQVPRSIYIVEEIPVNARGKVSRAELARQFRGS